MDNGTTTQNNAEQPPTTETKTTTKNPDGTETTTVEKKPAMPSLNLSAPKSLEDTHFATNEDYWNAQIRGFLINAPGFVDAVNKQKAQQPEQPSQQGQQPAKNPIVGWVSDKLGPVVRAAGDAINPGLVAGYDYSNMTVPQRVAVLEHVLSNPDTEATILKAMETGDMDALDMFFGKPNADPNAPADPNAEALKAVWERMPEERKQKYIEAGKKCAWNGIKSNFFTGIPKAIALWFKMKGWNDMGEFAKNPLNFYLTLGGLVVGGTALAGAAFGGGGGENQQPVINVNNGQSNPFYNNEI